MTSSIVMFELRPRFIVSIRTTRFSFDTGMMCLIRSVTGWPALTALAARSFESFSILTIEPR
jgi:hypothetical protein